jgi:hypothetical protein
LFLTNPVGLGTLGTYSAVDVAALSMERSMLAERLDKAWSARRGSTAIDAVMRFSDEGLVLGAGTVLAKSGGSGRNIQIHPREPRLRALLAAAHLGQPSAGALAHLEKAAERWSEGRDAFAAVHLALSRLDRLEQPEVDAHRLFLADSLLKSGIEPGAIIDAIREGGLGFDRLGKYDPDQPRVPAGSGRASGEWTSGGTAGDAHQSSQVNPSTITAASEPQGGPDVCRYGKIVCYDAAIDAATEAGEDAIPRADLKKCDQAYVWCNRLSLVIKYVPGLDRGAFVYPHPRYGGIIGTVLMEKGKQDQFIEFGNLIPPFRPRR